MSKNKELLNEFYQNKKYGDEEFKFLKYPDVNKYEYVISNYGRLFKFINGKEKKVHEDKDGYYMTSIYVTRKGVRKSITVGIHRLVAYTFIKNKPIECDIVNHLDGNKKNNKSTNLEFTTPKGNTDHAIKMGLQINSGPNCPSAIYPEKVVREICQYLEDGYDVLSIYKIFTHHEKVIDRAFYALIFSIKSKKRHREISSEYNIPDKIESITKKKFTPEEEDLIIKLIKEGKRSIDIVKIFGGTTVKNKFGRRICDKVRALKKTGLTFND